MVMIQELPTANIVTATLQLNTVTQDDAGAYACAASSAAGSDMVNFNVTVPNAGKPGLTILQFKCHPNLSATSTLNVYIKVPNPLL
jgi:hypothetical protein